MAALAFKILVVLGAIAILVFVHEMGHFLAARLFKMRVDRFSIGFPPTVFKRTVGDTEWVVGATPLGGYVKIAGMVDESVDTEYAASEPKPWEFRSKPVWQRIAVICAGVTFNILLAWLTFAGLKVVIGDATPVSTADGLVFIPDSSRAALEVGLQTGDRILSIDGHSLDQVQKVFAMADPMEFRVLRDGTEQTLRAARSVLPMSAQDSDGGVLGLGIYNWPAVLGTVQEGDPAWEAGLRPGDRITQVDGDPVVLWLDLTRRIQGAAGDTLAMVWQRPDGETRSGSVVAQKEGEGEYRIGVQIAQDYHRYGALAGLVSGAQDTWRATAAIAINLTDIVTGRASWRESIGGPVMVVQMVGEAAQTGASQFWRLVALLSITLAIVNILPIPALDGGHLIFLIYEGVTGREPSLRIRVAMQQVGMGLLIALMALLIFNDLMRL